MAWGCVLLAAVGYVVVPMFQMTPGYPVPFGRHFPLLVLAFLGAWSVSDWLWPESVGTGILGTMIIALAGSFALLTLSLQRRSKRAKYDTTQRYWQVAMFSTLAACVLWLLVRVAPPLADWRGWPLLCGVLLLWGGFMSVIIGMLYKIVPFLVWMHLQHQGLGRVIAPNMKKVLAELPMHRQMLAHFAAFALLLLAVVWPAGFVYPAGAAMLLANAWLLRNLWSALTVYRLHLVKIEAALAGGK